MQPQTIPGFDCLEFKWKVQSEIYEKTKNMTVEEQIEYFRQAAESGPFADLVKALRAREQKASGAAQPPRVESGEPGDDA
jgi:hypothetical protein